MAQEVINGKVVRRWFTRGKARIPIFEDGSIGIDRYVTQGMEDREKLKGETREQRQKWNNAFHYGHNKEYYENIMKKWEKDVSEAENTTEKKFAQGQYNAWKKEYDDTVEKENEFNKLYYGQNEVPDASYMVDYNAKTREGRYANYATVDVTKQDKAIESDIRSLFIYQNEPTMGTLEKDPMKRYYDMYGKENVDRVWQGLDDKYAVIEGTTMDNEGLRYNELVEKDKYSPEAIDFYRKQVENAWQNHSWDTKKYNEATAKAKEEFERFDSERKADKQLLANIGITGEKADEVLADREARTVTEESNPRKMVDYHLRKGNFSEADRIISDYGLEDEREEFLEGQNSKVRMDYNEYQKSKEDIYGQINAEYILNKPSIDDDINPMEEWSDTVGDGYSDAQRKAIETEYALNFGDSSQGYKDTKDVPFSEKVKAVRELDGNGTNSVMSDNKKAREERQKRLNELSDKSWQELGMRPSKYFKERERLELLDAIEDETDSYAFHELMNSNLSNEQLKDTLGNLRYYNKEEEEEQEEFEKGKEIYETYRHMSPREMDHFAKQHQDSIEKMNKYLKSNKELTEAKVERFKEKKGPVRSHTIDETIEKNNRKYEKKDLGINITEAPTRASQNTKLRSVPYEKGLDRAIDLNLSSTSYTAPKDAEILSSIEGQLSDGIWENSPGMERYWSNMAFTDNQGRLKMNVPKAYYNWDNVGYGRRNPSSNPFHEKTEEQIRTYVADKAKQIVKKNIEDNPSLGKWSRDNTNKVEYMGGHNAEVTVADVYSFYDRVKGRPGKKYNTYGKTSVARKDVDNIKAQVERYKKRKNK